MSKISDLFYVFCFVLLVEHSKSEIFDILHIGNFRFILEVFFDATRSTIFQTQ